MYGFIMMVDWAGIYFYIYCGYFVIAFLFIFVMIYPNLIMPLFNKFENLDENNATEKEILLKIEQMSKKMNFPLK